MEIRSLLNNRNVKILSVLCVLLGIALTSLVVGLCDRAQMEADKEWDKTLKFSSENAEEFPYSVKTKQGRLYAEGEIVAVSPLLTNDKLAGEYMAIRETYEEYRQHTEHYSCNCRTVNDQTKCDTCTRTYWSWDYAGSDTDKIKTISLLGQEMNGDMIPWDWHYESEKLANGDRYYQYTPYRRSYFSVITHAEGKWGFRSDEDGFRYDPTLNGPTAGIWLGAKWVLGILIMVGAIALAGANIYYNYELYYDNYI